MDRKVFKKELDGHNYPTKINKKKFHEIMQLMEEAHDHLDGVEGVFDLVKTSEELSELNVEIVNCLLGKPDSIGLVEEMADVYICMALIRDMYGISDETLNEAINIKMARNQARAINILKATKEFTVVDAAKKKSSKKKK